MQVSPGPGESFRRTLRPRCEAPANEEGGEEAGCPDAPTCQGQGQEEDGYGEEETYGQEQKKSPQARLIRSLGGIEHDYVFFSGD